MPNITTRGGKGSELSWQELDDNFTELDNRTKVSWQNLSSYLSVEGSSSPPIGTSYKGVAALAFQPGVVQKASSMIHLPHDYVDGSPIYPHIHLTITEPYDGYARFGFTYTYAKEYKHGEDNTYAQFFEPITVWVEKHLDAGDIDMQMVVEIPTPLQGNGLEKDSVLLLEISRDGAHVNDTFLGSCIVLATDIYYQTKTGGSPTR